MANSVHPSDPRRSRGKYNNGNNEASQPPLPLHSALSSADPRALMDPRLQPHRGDGGTTLGPGMVSSGTSFPLWSGGSSHLPHPPVMSSTLHPPYPAGPVFGVAGSQNAHQPSVRPPQSPLHMATHIYPRLQPVSHVPPQHPSSASSLPPVLPPPQQWFNSSQTRFPLMTHLPSPPPFTLQPGVNAYVHPVAPVSLSSPLPFLRPPPLPLLPPQNFPPHPPQMGPQSGHGPRFVAPHRWTKEFQLPNDLSQQGLPGFKPAPAPVGIEEKMGLIKDHQKVEGQESGSDGGLIGHRQSETDVSDPFITNWLKRVEGSYVRHQQHQFELKQHSMKVCVHYYTVYMPSIGVC